MKYWFHPEARTELLESVRHYEGQQSGLGLRFLDAATEAVRRVQAHPNMYRVVSGTWRQCRISRFPFGIIYGTIQLTKQALSGGMNARSLTGREPWTPLREPKAND